tara:strand:- start:89 stop:211 length:123 start_codon:yes stop_codon:yes gene_type:complete
MAAVIGLSAEYKPLLTPIKRHIPNVQVKLDSKESILKRTT